MGVVVVEDIGLRGVVVVGVRSSSVEAGSMGAFALPFALFGLIHEMDDDRLPEERATSGGAVGGGVGVSEEELCVLGSSLDVNGVEGAESEEILVVGFMKAAQLAHDLGGGSLHRAVLNAVMCRCGDGLDIEQRS